MANEPKEPKAASAAIDVKSLIVEALKDMPQDELRAILLAAGAAPTTIGMTTESMQSLISGFTSMNAETMRQTLRAQRKENPAYPEKSVFHPEGKFDDLGNALPAKVKLRRRTYHNHVLISDELVTEEEITLLNAITEDKTARNGKWTAEIREKGTTRERMLIVTPSNTPDERMENSLPFPLILRELIDGPDAVNPATMAARITALEDKLKAAGLSV